MAKGKGKARTFGQDLMRGEHTVGGDEAAKAPPGTGATPPGVETASLKGGLTFGASMHPYDGSADCRALRREADQRASNLQGFPKLPGWADNGTENVGSGTSIFDPVLCELAYRWFSPEGGTVLDPFSGGSVRGIVAAALGRRYVGIDLRAEQIAANEAQWAAIAPRLGPGAPAPRWIVGDSQHIAALAGDVDADLFWSCPPYADLEVYSDDPRDLSTMAYADFLAAYRRIIAAGVARLRPDRFACFVVGDVRDPRGFYRNFVSDTIAAFLSAGCGYYNEGILVTAVGSLPIRAGRQFAGGRKFGKTHQNVLVFVKGDPKRATEACGDVDMGDLEALLSGAPVAGGAGETPVVLEPPGGGNGDVAESFGDVLRERWPPC